MPLGHLGLNVPDLVRAREYYDRLMPGYETFLSAPDQFAYKPVDGKIGPYLFYPSRDDGGSPWPARTLHVTWTHGRTRAGERVPGPYAGPGAAACADLGTRRSLARFRR